jgi:DNA-binding MarR family transcriptional regulator
VRARKTAGDARREQLIEALNLAGRENSTASVLFHSAMAERFGLSATDEKTIELLSRLGPLTAGQLAERTGLASASVTALIDRLEQKGFVRRVRDPADRRRVIVELVPKGVAKMAAAFVPFQRSLDRFWAEFSVEQLEVIRDFLVRSAERLRAETARLAPSGDSADQGSTDQRSADAARRTRRRRA